MPMCLFKLLIHPKIIFSQIETITITMLLLMGHQERVLERLQPDQQRVQQE
jgi:hypothetical protein